MNFSWLKERFSRKQEVEVQQITPTIEDKSNPTPSEQKSASLSGRMSFVDYLRSNGNEDLSAYASIALYKKAMPFFNAVSMRAEAFAQIPIRVRDKKTKDFVDDHPALDLLKQPNADVSQQEFLEQMSSYYDICGESFVAATGRISGKPLELSVIGPQMINFSNLPNRSFGMLNIPESIDVCQTDGLQSKFRSEEVNQELGLRFINNDQNAEIWHIRGFNPTRSSTNFRGMSKAQPLWMEIQQYVSGNITNLSNLKRGTRLSMAWVNTGKEELTDTQWERAQEEAQKYSGDANAGGTPILDGMDVKSIQQTNRDMEFKALQEDMLARISSTYRIPLALLLPATMTLDNLKTSMLQFFDNSVLPSTSRLYSEMTRMIMPRYKGSENFEFCYNELDIPALRSRILENAKLMKEIGANTPDEIRKVIGDDQLSQGGDKLYIQSSMVPIGEDFDDDEDFGVDDL